MLRTPPSSPAATARGVLSPTVQHDGAKTAPPTELAIRWRAEAAVLLRRGAEQQATTLESCAADLEQWARKHELEELTLEQAGEESGYSYSALQKMLATGRLVNAGDAHRPRILRGDLPRKPGRGGVSRETDLVTRVLTEGAMVRYRK